MDSSESEVFYCERKCSGASARGCLVVDGLGKACFTVFKGSVVSRYVCDNLQHGERYKPFYRWRLRLQDSGVIEDGVFQADYTFSSPSLAATVVLGSNSNGNEVWHTKDGRLLRDVRTDDWEMYRR